MTARQSRAAPAGVGDRPVSELLEIVGTLGHGERHVLLAIARRLAMGARQYGPLRVQEDPRDWRKEAVEELLDATAYLAMAAMREEVP